ncbi:histidine kinase [Actinoplanes sp. NPDC024001]|uniref:sensor histidine kinase n=1 Tax=Actinoplanes sp. NPDC024001 TaxID=3154598 RepID=UPI0033E410E4
MTSVRRRDLVGALVICAWLLAWTRWVSPQMPFGREIDVGAYLLVAVNSLALIWRRSAPLRVLAVTTLASSAYMWLEYAYGPALLPFAIAVYTVARHLPWRTAAVAAGIALPVLASHNLNDGLAVTDLTSIFPAAGWVAVPFAIGTTIAQRTESVTRDRREAVERGIQEERLRMAQEVHDIVGHGLAAIKMQADIALHVLHKQPEIARPTLEAVSTTSAQALDELRTTLRMLRSADESKASTPGLADLDALYQRMRDAGLRVRVRTIGSPSALPAETDMTAYRTIQESLTNVLKHAYPKEADIVLENEPGALRIRVISAHPESETPRSGGLGIAGMRERIAAHGGRFAAGPAPGARFVVDAWLPVGTS